MIPKYVFVAFQATFAAITVALVVGAFAERMRFAAVMIFAVVHAERHPHRALGLPPR